MNTDAEIIDISNLDSGKTININNTIEPIIERIIDMKVNVLTRSIFFAIKTVIAFCVPIPAKIETIPAILIKYEISPNSSGDIMVAMYIQNTLVMPLPITSPIPIIPIFFTESKKFIFLFSFI